MLTAVLLWPGEGCTHPHFQRTQARVSRSLKAEPTSRARQSDVADALGVAFAMYANLKPSARANLRARNPTAEGARPSAPRSVGETCDSVNPSGRLAEAGIARHGDGLGAAPWAVGRFRFG